MNEPPTAGSDCSYQPSIADIIQIKKLFRTRLPIELADQIIDEAECWAHSSVELIGCELAAHGRHGDGENVMYMRTMPLALYGTQGNVQLRKQDAGALHRRIEVAPGDSGRPEGDTWLPPRGERPARKIVFELESRDQGWSGDGDNHDSYRGSYTWFDAGVESISLDVKELQDKGPTQVEWDVPMIRNEYDSASFSESPIHFVLKDPLSHPFLPPSTHLQRNLHAEGEWRTHTIEWHYLDRVEQGSVDAKDANWKGRGWKSMDGTFVRKLCVGDCITLWLRARFPGWRCDIRKAKIEVFWVV